MPAATTRGVVTPPTAVCNAPSGEVTSRASPREETTEQQPHVSAFFRRDKRVVQLADANRAAIDAALAAQKDSSRATNESNAAAIAKSEIGFTKQFDQIHQSIVSSNKSVDEKIDDLKSRMDRGEGRSRGLGDGWGYLAAALGILIAIGSLIVMMMRR